MRRMGHGLSDHYVLCKVRLVGLWIKRREMVVGARRNRSKKLRNNQYREGNVKFLEGKGVEWDGGNIEHMREQVEQAMVERAREVCSSLKVGGKKPKEYVVE